MYMGRKTNPCRLDFVQRRAYLLALVTELRLD